MTTSTATHLTRFARAIVPVSDQDRALAFYTGVLGFEKVTDVQFGEGERWIEVRPPGATPGAGTLIALSPPMGAKIGDGEHARVCLSFESADVDAAHAALRERGAPVQDIIDPAAPAPRMFFLRDPDGNALHVAQEG
jgi:catechol 2,3-dioxygenase-like lactoylglutathione lyase family enzyme